MRKIWPATNPVNPVQRSIDEKPITEAQYVSLENKVEEQNDAIEALETDLSNYKKSIKERVTTDEVDSTAISAENITSTTITADSLNVDEISGDNIEVDDTHIALKRNVTIAGNTVAKDVTADSVTTDNLVSGRIVANEIDAPTINVQSVNTNDFTTDSLTATELTAEYANIEESSISRGSIEDANIDSADINSASVDELEVNKEEVIESKISTLDNSIAIHSKYQLIEDIDEGWIILPRFTNGVYYLEGKAPGDIRLFSIEVDNSQENVRFKWSMNKKNFLLDADIVRDDPFEFLQLHFQTFGYKVYLYYKSDSTDNINPPAIYSTQQYTSNIRKHFVFSQMSGSILPNSIFAGQFHAEELLIDDTVFDKATIESEIVLTQEKDLLGHTVVRTSGNPGDIITNVEDEYGNVYPTWEGRSTLVDSADEKLITSKAVAEYDGVDYAGTKGSVEEVKSYPIKHLGNNAKVHGSLDVEGDFTSPSISDETFTNEDDEEVQVLKLNNPYRTSDEKPFTVADDLEDGKAVIYDEENDVLKSTDDLELENLDVLNLNVGRNAIVGGDLIVKGKTITKEEETVSTSSDMVILRQNNNTSLASGETSGILINKYDGVNNLAIVTDDSGTLRIGDVSGTTHTYPVIYYSDSKWYTDEELEQEVTPQGELTSYASKIVENTYTKYTNAIFTKFNYEDLSPVLARDEISNLTNNALLIFNKTTQEANTITVPTTNGSSLKYNTATNKYYWEKSAGIYWFADRASYDAVENDIPEGSLVLIQNLKDYTISEEVE